MAISMVAYPKVGASGALMCSTGGMPMANAADFTLIVKNGVGIGWRRFRGATHCFKMPKSYSGRI